MSTNTFPLPVTAHVIFAAIAFIFFVVQFIRMKHKYQLLLAIAVPATLLLYVNESKTWFYIIGVVELVLLAASFISSIMDKKMLKLQAAESTDDETIDTNDTVNTDEENTEGNKE